MRPKEVPYGRTVFTRLPVNTGGLLPENTLYSYRLRKVRPTVFAGGGLSKGGEASYLLPDAAVLLFDVL